MAVPAQTAASNAPAAQPAAPSDSGQSGASTQNTGPDAAQTSGPGGQEQVSRGPDYFREAFSRVRGQRQPANPAPQAPPASPSAESPENGTSENPQAARTQGQRRKNGQPAQGANPASTTLPSGQGQTAQGDVITLTKEQLQRQVQSEADRILAKRLADERLRQQQDEERRLRQEDPLEYVRRIEEKEKELEETQAKLRESSTLLDQQLFTYDRQILDPVLGSLPDALRDRVIKASNPQGIEGRAGMLKNALSALRQVWQAEVKDSVKDSLMNDQLFVKEVLARYGGVPKGEIEPAAPSSRASNGAPTSGNDAVNDWIRIAGQAARTTSGRRG